MNELIEILKALNEPVRIRILNLLSQGELCVCDIMSVLELPQSTVSRHLSILKSSGIVSSRKEGLWHYYRVNKKSEPEADIFVFLKKFWEKDSFFEADREKLKLQCAFDEKNSVLL